MIPVAAFKENELIPARYTCDGKNVNPALNFDNIPSETHTLAIIVDDPDAPVGTWTHWLIWNIPVTHHLKEDHAPGIQGVKILGKIIMGVLVLQKEHTAIFSKYMR